MTAAAVHLVPSTRTTPTTHPVAPHPTRRTVNARSIVTAGALASSVAVFVVAMLTSAASLYEIAVAENLAAPWGLPVVLDLLATASAAVAWVTRSWGARLAAAGAFATSLGLQVSHVYAQGPTAWITHSAAPVSAVLMFEVALILAGRTERHGADPIEVADEPESATPEPAPAPVKPAAFASVSPVVRPALKPASDVDPAVLAKVRQALDEMKVPAEMATRDAVLKHLRPGAPHATKVGAALRHLKEQQS
jgi:hypothetical protein